MKLKVGTRGSRLSRMQTEEFLEALKQMHQNVEFELKIIKTLGDTEKTKPLFTIDSQGIFEKEIDQALLNGEVDFAVASLKDVPSVETAETVVAAIPERASPCDVLVSKDNIQLKNLREGAVIGTGSLRRLYKLNTYARTLKFDPSAATLTRGYRKCEEAK